MDPIVLTALVTALGTQVVAVIRAAKGQRALADSVGEQNGLGTVHQALHVISAKLDTQAEKLDGLDRRVSVLEVK